LLLVWENLRYPRIHQFWSNSEDDCRGAQSHCLRPGLDRQICKNFGIFEKNRLLIALLLGGFNFHSLWSYPSFAYKGRPLFEGQ
jgi:hypothetical protein